MGLRGSRLRHHREDAGGVRHKLQVDERRLDRAVAEPAREVVYGDGARQKVSGVTVTQSVA